ncbi:hypothetical protein [Saccharothrix lopnurensis]|uniref:Uncharacterized protein n=1 Tax=Saccharothrix lopnurensis TaxID=1670621 RepID=A0ABW1P9B7_9PSEU
MFTGGERPELVLAGHAAQAHDTLAAVLPEHPAVLVWDIGARRGPVAVLGTGLPPATVVDVSAD